VASARLFAAGVERQQRLLCLRFLGILLASADDGGHVHTDPDDLAGLGLLHGMSAEEVNRSRVLLETFGVLEREPTGWSIVYFTPIDDEIAPAEALAAISRVLAKPADDEATATTSAPAPTPVAAAEAQPTVIPLDEARARRVNRWTAPVGAAAAAAVVLVALLVSGQMRVPLTSTPASNSNQNAIGTGVGATPQSTEPGAPPSSGPGPSTSSRSVASTNPSPQESPSSAPPLGTPSPTQGVCPLASVSATVDKMSQQLGSSIGTSVSASVPQIVQTSVNGTVHNNSAAPVVVNPFPVTVNFTDPAGRTSSTVTATALSAPATIAQGASLAWTVTVQNPKQAPVPTTADAGQPTWHWADSQLAILCPH
jgi:hypothetical protein